MGPREVVEISVCVWFVTGGEGYLRSICEALLSYQASVMGTDKISLLRKGTVSLGCLRGPWL